MTDPLETLLVNAEWHAVEIKRDRGGDYLQEAETGDGITLAELVKRYNSLISQLALRPSPTPTQGWQDTYNELDELIGVLERAHIEAGWIQVAPQFVTKMRLALAAVRGAGGEGE